MEVDVTVVHDHRPPVYDRHPPRLCVGAVDASNDQRDLSSPRMLVSRSTWTEYGRLQRWSAHPGDPSPEPCRGDRVITDDELHLLHASNHCSWAPTPMGAEDKKGERSCGMAACARHASVTAAREQGACRVRRKSPRGGSGPHTTYGPYMVNSSSCSE